MSPIAVRAGSGFGSGGGGGGGGGFTHARRASEMGAARHGKTKKTHHRLGPARTSVGGTHCRFGLCSFRHERSGLLNRHAGDLARAVLSRSAEIENDSVGGRSSRGDRRAGRRRRTGRLKLKRRGAFLLPRHVASRRGSSCLWHLGNHADVDSVVEHSHEVKVPAGVEKPHEELG